MCTFNFEFSFSPVLLQIEEDTKWLISELATSEFVSDIEKIVRNY